MSKHASNPWARRRARRALLQAVYAWQMTTTDFADLSAQFVPDRRTGKAPTQAYGPMKGADETYFLDCLRGVLDAVGDLDPLFAPYLDRAITALDHVERAILRIGTFELKERLDVPARVVINEWVELAKTFGAEQSFRYINGVLDRVGRDLRPELQVAADSALPETTAGERTTSAEGPISGETP